MNFIIISLALITHSFAFETSFTCHNRTENLNVVVGEQQMILTFEDGQKFFKILKKNSASVQAYEPASGDRAFFKEDSESTGLFIKSKTGRSFFSCL